MTRAFLCHSSADSKFVLEVAKYLKRCLDDVFCYEEYQRTGSFIEEINRQLVRCEVMVVFVGSKLTKWQISEVNAALNEDQSGRDKHFFVYLLKHDDLPSELTLLSSQPRRSLKQYDSRDALSAAREISDRLGVRFHWDGLPGNAHLFSYEKHIIDHFSKVSRLNETSFRIEPAAAGDEKAKESIDELESIRRKWLGGCPERWPEVVCWAGEDTEPRANRLSQGDIGERRLQDNRVIAAALSTYHACGNGGDPEKRCCMMEQGLCFPEAGPRDSVYFPRPGEALQVAIAVSGGIAPGINAVIDGIVQRHHLYAKTHGYQDSLRVIGLKNGFRAFDAINDSQEALKTVDTSKHANEGGSLLGTSRANELLDTARRRDGLMGIVTKLVDTLGIDILYVIGGDGSMKAAHAIWTVAQEYVAEQEKNGRDVHRLSVVAIPKTMDNDILWVWQAFGFLSAVEKAREIIEHLATEVQANPRLCVAQLFGSDSGFVVSHAVLASRTGHCDLALIPEARFTMEDVALYMMRKMLERRRDIKEIIPRGMIVMAETAIPEDAMDFVDEGRPNYIDIDLSKDEKDAIREFERLREAHERIQGQTSDHLRSAGLKIVSRGLYKILRDERRRQRLLRKMPDELRNAPRPRWKRLRMFTNEPRHVLRAIPPSCTDIIMGNRLGTLAVDNALAGYTDFMMSQWLTEYVLVPLELVTLGRKRIPTHGIFWKSVIAKTGQPAELAPKKRGDGDSG
ncbi:MAG: 6-phosphofructokinase [Phycisphaerales bacterium]|nr:MAG: 6-phosphofructokinase [Phycisphaerales bacterium]